MLTTGRRWAAWITLHVVATGNNEGASYYLHPSTHPEQTNPLRVLIPLATILHNP